MTTRRVAHRRARRRGARPARSGAGRASCTPTISGTRRSARATSGARSFVDAIARCASARSLVASAVRVREPLRRAPVGRVARAAAAHREHRDRRGGAGPLSPARRRRALRGARRRCSRCRGDDVDHARCSRASGVRSAKPIRTSAPTSASSSTGCRSRRRCTLGAARCCSSSSCVVIAALRADAEPAVGARRAVRVGVRAPPLHDARRRAAARSSRGATGSTCIGCSPTAAARAARSRSVDHRVDGSGDARARARHAVRRRGRDLGGVERADAPRLLLRQRRAAAVARRAHRRAARSRDARSIRTPTDSAGASVSGDAAQLHATRATASWTACGPRRWASASRSTAELSGRIAVWDAGMLRRFAERERDVAGRRHGAGWSRRRIGADCRSLVERGDGGASDGRELWSLGRFDAAARRRARSTRSRSPRPVASATRP